MRPLNRSTMPLVLGVLGLVSRCSMPSSWHSWSNSWWPLGSRSRLANSRSVNSLPLSVNSLLILIGQRMRQGLPALALDLDHFKKINDTWGHGGGDDVLRQFVALAQQCLRKEDVMGRLGGEEFAIFLLNADGPGAEAVAERLRALVESQPLRADHHAIPVTVSIGVALCTRGDSAETVLKRADAAMYLAKQNGRNRVEVVASPVPI